MSGRRFWAGICVLGLALLTAACAGDGGGAGGETGGGGDENLVRFAFAPDPVWDYLKDTGIREEMEKESGIRIVDQASWDEFGLYAGGHADVVSVASFEVPLLEKETGQESLIFGKYNIDRSVVVAPSDSPAETLADVEGEKVAVWDTVSSTVIWGILAKELHDADFRPEGGDYELVLADITNTGELAASGDAAAALVLPDFAIPQLQSGRAKVLYDGQTSADLYSDVVGQEHEGPMLNIFLARKDWLETHQEEARFFLEVWERGIQEWQKNKDEIIESYPQHFAAETPQQIEFIKNYLDENDWFVSSIYLDEEWVERESQIFDLMRENGFLEEDDPEFEIITP